MQRLEKVFQSLGTEVRSEHCEAMEGLIGEGEEIIEADGDGNAKDAALIGAAQRVEHYEIAGTALRGRSRSSSATTMPRRCWRRRSTRRARRTRP